MINSDVFLCLSAPDPTTPEAGIPELELPRSVVLHYSEIVIIPISRCH